MKVKKLSFLVLVVLLNSCSSQNNINMSNIEKPIIREEKTNNTQNNLIKKEIKTLKSLGVEEIKEVADSGIVTANNKFGLNLFLDIVKEKKNENIFISPASVALALQMAYNGAYGQTKDEMAKTLEINKFSLDETNKLSSLLIRKLNTPADDIKLTVANSLWVDKSRVEIFSDFKNNLSNYYNATSQELNFLDSKSVDTINQWTSDNTNGKIPKVINKIDDETISYLMNAIYFKANWKTEFKKSETNERDFTLPDKTIKQHPLGKIKK